MNADETYDFTRACQLALAMLDGHATAVDVAHKVRSLIGDERYVSATFPGFVAQVRRGLATDDSQGLPQALSIDGEYVQRGLFEASHYESAIRGYVRRSREMVNVARLLADECQNRLGMRIDVDALIEESA